MVLPDPPQPKPTIKTGAVPLAEAIDHYHARVVARSGRTASGYTFTLSQFYKSCQANKKFVQDITEDDLLNFVKFLRATGVGNRTIYNRLVEVGTFLRASGVPGVKEMLKSAQVRYTAKAVSAYSEDEVRQFFAACNPENRLLFEFFLGSGCREGEVMHACYSDINFTDRIYTVRDKPQWGFTSKDHADRPIPIPATLVQALLVRRQLHPNDVLIFPNRNGDPNGHFLRRLKNIVKNAGMGGHWELHKWRKSFASFHHEQGVSARTLQMWLGHSDLKTTED